MTAPVLVLLGAEVSVSTAQTVGVTSSSPSGASLLRVYNSNGADVLVTIKNASGTTLGSTTIKAGAVEYIRKMPTDTITCATSCKVTPISG